MHTKVFVLRTITMWVTKKENYEKFESKPGVWKKQHDDEDGSGSGVVLF